MNPAEFNYGEILNCMRCGFCLPTCPTYVHLENEAASPRGRIALMKAAADGRLELADMADQMNVCLGCRNCESVCPSGVHFGALLEDAREAVAATRPRGLARRLFFDWVFRSRPAIGLLGTLLWLYQASGLRWLAHATRLARLLPRHMWEMDAALPRVRAPWRRRRAAVTPARGPRRLRVGMFTGCVMDVLFWEANQAAIDLLAAAGCEVVVVPGQGCCGALHAHSGEKPAARGLARANIAAFGALELDCVVNAAGGCGAALREYGHWFRGDPEWAERAAGFGARVRDLSEVLDELGLPVSAAAAAAPARRVTMQESCHLAHGQGVRNQPRRLIRGVPGAELCELAEPDRCCGSAGIYNLTQPELSMRILDAKMEQVRATGARAVITTNPGCLLQMRLGIVRAGLAGQVEATHLSLFLRQALEDGR